jgi:CubicO group peptidase (beta-lactamase class C family)
VQPLGFRRIRRFAPASVTAIAREDDPREGGLSARDIDAIWGSAVELYRTGLHPALALCVRRRGAVVLDRAIGHRIGNAPEDAADAVLDPATPATLFNLFSASKMITAMLIHLLDQRRQLHIDDRVAHYIPEFGKCGKEWITIRHVLTHRSGIPSVPGTYDPLELLPDPERILQILYELEPVSVPGRRLAYHALTGGYVLGEIVRRVTGQDVRAFLRAEVLEPLGFRHLAYGVPEHEIDLVARNARTGPPLLPPATALFKRALGVDFRDAAALSNDPRYVTGVVPAGNAIATANEASRFMQLLLRDGELDGVRIFEPRTIHRAVAEQSYLELDLTLGLPIRYGMGFILGADYLSLYGLHTEKAFGHIGFTNVVLFADPERDISVALLTSGKPIVTPGQLRWLWVLQTIAHRCPRDWGAERPGPARHPGSGRAPARAAARPPHLQRRSLVAHLKRTWMWSSWPGS